MRERPILFNGAMVHAILSGEKTQTRRTAKGVVALHARTGEALAGIDSAGPRVACPFGQPGDRLWVRETFSIGEDLGAGWKRWMEPCDRFPIYEADGERGRYDVVPLEWNPPRNAPEVHNSEGTDEHWRTFGPISSTQMPRWASRLVLEITDVRVERLQAISEADARAEGLHSYQNEWRDSEYPLPDIAYEAHDGAARRYTDPRHAFRDLWTSTGGDWDSNPWIWVIEFKRVEVDRG